MSDSDATIAGIVQRALLLADHCVQVMGGPPGRKTAASDAISAARTIVRSVPQGADVDVPHARAVRNIISRMTEAAGDARCYLVDPCADTRDDLIVRLRTLGALIDAARNDLERRPDEIAVVNQP
jgi:hypothetical protein